MSHDDLCPVDPPRLDDAFCMWCEVIRKVRTDEAKRMNERWRTQVLDNEREQMRLDICADLRAKVETLPIWEDSQGWKVMSYLDVVALLERGSE